jgi:DoxX-like family
LGLASALAVEEVKMHLALWIIAGALAVVFGLSRLMKLGVWKDQLVASSNMGWAEGFSQAQIRWIGGAEFCGPLGLVAQRFVITRVPSTNQTSPMILPAGSRTAGSAWPVW